ncbi:MAG: DUF6364 family protein [Terriglobales bacterium]
MKNITLSIDEETLAAGRAYAKRHNTSLNQLVRDLLRRNVVEDREAKIKEMFRLMDEHPGDSHGWKWNREEIYED